ncbi:MAG: DUF47 family protein [Thermoleophilia bacterium]
MNRFHVIATKAEVATHMSDMVHGLLIAHSQKVSMAVHALKSASEAWQRGDLEDLERYVADLSDLEKEADSLRRNVAREISAPEIPHAKRELFRRLVHETDNVADTARRAGRFLLIIKDLLLPPQIKSDIVKMTSLCQAAMSRLAEAIHCLSEPPERRSEHVAHISELEESVDDLEFKIQHEASGLTVDTWSAIILWRLVITVSRIADNVEDAADELLAYEGEL